MYVLFTFTRERRNLRETMKYGSHSGTQPSHPACMELRKKFWFIVIANEEDRVNHEIP